MNEFEIIDEKRIILGKIGHTISLIKEDIMAHNYRLTQGTEDDNKPQSIRKNLDKIVPEFKKNYDTIISELSNLAPHTNHSELIMESIKLLTKAKNQLQETYDISLRSLSKLQNLDVGKNITIIHQFDEIIRNSFEKYLSLHNNAVMLLGTYRHRQAA